MPTGVQITELNVNRGGRSVLTDFTCEIPPGRVTGLLGPSGSGKTTMMRAIVGVQRIRSGTITVLGLAAGDPRLRRRVGYVTQEPSIYADLSVAANVTYFATLYGVGAAEAHTAIGDVGLSEAADQLAGNLSGGQHARASLACALVAHPELLILDEPTVGQDPVLRRDLWQHFHRLAETGTTVLVSSHVMDEAARCDRLLLIRQGRLIADDTPDGLRRTTGETDLEAAFLSLVSRGTDALCRFASRSPPRFASSRNCVTIAARSH
ncbi:ABC-2 type transport system ATP-binding protein [Stackebrandtia endophytica]|uniref:ABC-2 type transport system ATP-binding protein n=1 Tax=Stackebrandtia endophytica TaxID=1496996 RepID=A0A543AQH3_9ACTN|nr:ABC transporter ATP-binding protein [Stackebrandtia endophytica]TQL74832.1 ABC-2 type transport system ATP-binding protein [Stackebrandtia endophytica]